MNPKLPDELQRWFTEHSWTVLRAERMVGGFAAVALYRIDTLSPDTTRRSLIYKQMAPDRSSEWSIYESLSAQLADYMPHVFARIEGPHGRGLLLEDVGLPLKHVLQRATPEKQRSLVLQAVGWLTDMHIRFGSHSHARLQAGVLNPYPVASSLVWAEEALERVTWAADAGIAGLTVGDIRDLRKQTQRFYPHLETWMQGRPTLTHGDPHLENLLVREQTFKLADWEFASVAIPQRDLAVFVQDILDDELRAAAYDHFCSALRAADWRVDEEVFRVGWLACFFDNTLMMLGWEVFKYRLGHLSLRELEAVAAAKSRWLQNAFCELSRLAL